MNIAVIGATGKLGKALMKTPGTIECPVRFEDADNFKKWFDGNKSVDTVWYVARACGKTGVRRSVDTFMLEHNAMLKLLETRAKDCRFVYASSKIVYGLSGVSDKPDEVIPVEEVAKQFKDTKVGVYNCPEWQNTCALNINGLDNQRTIYATTKLANENLVVKYCSNFKIVRIWDIAQ